MESIGLDMEDIFDDRNDDEAEEDFAMPPPMPDLDVDEGAMADGAEQDAAGGDDEVQKKLRDMSKGAGKKRVMRPQPKLDAARLKGERGLPILPKLFTEVKFRGKGHEAEDLKRLMGKLEHWGHRLFPKMPFDEFIGRLEKLGSKKEVQNCVKRIRLDMPILDEDFVSQEADEHIENAVNTSATAPPDELTDMDAEEAYEEMIRQERAQMEQQKQNREENNQEHSSPVSSQTTLQGGSPPRINGHAAETTLTPGSKRTSEETYGGLTAEQLEKIERNKRLAMERRMAKLGRTPTSQSQTMSTPASTSSSTNMQSGENHPEQRRVQETMTPSNKNTTDLKEKSAKANPPAGMPTDDLQTEDEIMSTLLEQEENMDTGEVKQISDCTNENQEAENSIKNMEEMLVGTDDSAADPVERDGLAQELDTNVESETLKLKLSVSDSDVTQSDITDGNSTMDSVIMETNPHTEDLNLHMSPTQNESNSTHLQLNMSATQSESDNMNSQAHHSKDTSNENERSNTESKRLALKEIQPSDRNTSQKHADSETLDLKLSVTEEGSESMEIVDDGSER